MKTKSKIKWALLGLLGISAVSIPAITLVSCSNSDNKQQTITANIQNKQFNAVVNDQTTRAIGNKISYITNPEDNPEAKAEADKIFDNFNKDQLNKDFNFGIEELFDAYEFNSSKLEAEIDNISVHNYDSQTHEVTLKVVYEAENDYDHDADDYKTTRDTEQRIVQYRKMTLKEKFVDDAEIQALKDLLSTDQNKETFRELYEFYFGENDEDWDDIGIFDKLKVLKKDLSSSGSLLGYDVDLYALEPVMENGKIITIDDPSKAMGKTSTQTENYFVPSMSTSYFFYATIQDNLPESVKQSGKKVNIVLDDTKLKTMTIDEFKTKIQNFNTTSKPEDYPLKDIPNTIPITDLKTNKELTNISTLELTNTSNFIIVKFVFATKAIKLNNTEITEIKYYVPKTLFKTTSTTNPQPDTKPDTKPQPTL